MFCFVVCFLYAPLDSILAMDWAKEGFSATIKTVFILNRKTALPSNLYTNNKKRTLKSYKMCPNEKSDFLQRADKKVPCNILWADELYKSSNKRLHIPRSPWRTSCLLLLLRILWAVGTQLVHYRHQMTHDSNDIYAIKFKKKCKTTTTNRLSLSFSGLYVSLIFKIHQSIHPCILKNIYIMYCSDLNDLFSNRTFFFLHFCFFLLLIFPTMLCIL